MVGLCKWTPPIPPGDEGFAFRPSQNFQPSLAAFSRFGAVKRPYANGYAYNIQGSSILAFRDFLVTEMMELRSLLTSPTPDFTNVVSLLGTIDMFLVAVPREFWRNKSLQDRGIFPRAQMIVDRLTRTHGEIWTLKTCLSRSPCSSFLRCLYLFLTRRRRLLDAGNPRNTSRQT